MDEKSGEWLVTSGGKGGRAGGAETGRQVLKSGNPESGKRKWSADGRDGFGSGSGEWLVAGEGETERRKQWILDGLEKK